MIRHHIDIMYGGAETKERIAYTHRIINLLWNLIPNSSSWINIVVGRCVCMCVYGVGHTVRLRNFICYCSPRYRTTCKIIFCSFSFLFKRTLTHTHLPRVYYPGPNGVCDLWILLHTTEVFQFHFFIFLIHFFFVFLRPYYVLSLSAVHMFHSKMCICWP